VPDRRDYFKASRQEAFRPEVSDPAKGSRPSDIYAAGRQDG